MALDLRDFEAAAFRAVERHALERPGAYARWTRPHDVGPGGLGENPYGCADAANILYTLGRFPRDAERRRGFAARLRALQSPEDGLFHEATHHPLHTTAHCLAALALFDAGPAAPLVGLAPLREPARVDGFLDGLDWRGQPWTESHRGAGLYAALTLAGEASPAWRERYFAWLAREQDPASGLLRRGAVPPLADVPDGDARLFPHLAGTFHYLFCLEDARRPLRHPAALVDTCLEVFARELFPFSRFVGFAEIDWVYCLTRSLRQCGHRFPEAQRALRAFAERHVRFLASLDPETDDGLDDLHALFGTLCALAELQQALPGELRTARPLRLVLDRRPFI